VHKSCATMRELTMNELLNQFHISSYRRAGPKP
jgi:hypothetical protein